MSPMLGPGEYICNDCGKTKTRNDMQRVNGRTPTGKCWHCYHLQNHIRWHKERALVQHMRRYLPETARVIEREQYELHKDDALVDTKLVVKEQRKWRQEHLGDANGH